MGTLCYWEEVLKILYCGWGGAGTTWTSLYGESLVYYMRQMGHEVKPIYYRPWIKDHPERNFDLMLIAEADEMKPDFILLLKCEVIDPATIKELKNRGHKVVYYSCDDPQLFLRSQKSREIALSANIALTWCEDTLLEYRKRGIPAAIIYAGYDPRIWDYSVIVEEQEKKRYGADVIFLGSPYYGSPVNRTDMVQVVINAGFYFKLFGPKEWLNVRELEAYYFGYLDVVKQESTKAIKCAKAVLNCAWSRGTKTPSIRMFEVVGLGQVCVSYLNPGMNTVLPEGKGVVYWSTYPELIAKLKKVISDEAYRKQVEKDGREYVLANFTTEIQTKKMLDFISPLLK